jgi:hypothetical protein
MLVDIRAIIRDGNVILQKFGCFEPSDIDDDGIMTLNIKNAQWVDFCKLEPLPMNAKHFKKSINLDYFRLTPIECK